MKIAVLGSAPSSITLAPYGDPSWEIWGCSPGLYKYVSRNGLRISRWMEIHHFIPPANEFSPEYIAWMGSLAPAPVYMIEAQPCIPNSVAYPLDQMLTRFGPYFFTSSVAYMLALALAEIETARAGRAGPEQDVIGLWGIDMAATEEYGLQRPACHHYIDMAERQMGIKVTVPPQSDLLWPPPLYGFHEADPRAVKLYTRMNELRGKLVEAESAHAANEREMFFFRGAMSDMQYHLNNLGHSDGR